MQGHRTAIAASLAAPSVHWQLVLLAMMLAGVNRPAPRSWAVPIATQEDAKGDVTPWLPQTEDNRKNVRFIRDAEARKVFHVDGEGLGVVIVSSGVNATHSALSHAILPGRNFTKEGDESDTQDFHGVGSHLAGIIAGRFPQLPDGVAPKVKVVPLKVVNRDGEGNTRAVQQALEWILANQHRYQIQYNVTLSVVCMSFTTDDCLTRPVDLPASLQGTVKAIKELASRGVVVCAPTGSNFAKFAREGVGFPAIIPETISVGAMSDVDFSPDKDNRALFTVVDAKIFEAKRGQITPFTQRLSSQVGGESVTDIFAPGLSVVSSGGSNLENDADNNVIVLSGTSPACGFAAATVALLQQRAIVATDKYGDMEGERNWLPPVSLAERCLRDCGRLVTSAPGEQMAFSALDVYGALERLQKMYDDDALRYRQEWLLHVQNKNPEPFSTKLRVLGRKLNTPNPVSNAAAAPQPSS